MKLIRLFKNVKGLRLFLFTIFILHSSLFIFSCSTSTDVSKGSLSGTISLEGLSDYSNISVSLYDLAYLDTTITRINSEYPQIGVIISQHTEFDHRFQTPLYSTETEADGSFEIKKIPTGIYNLVAEKAGYGFRYILEIGINEGDNEISNDEFTMFNFQLNPNERNIKNSKLKIKDSTITLYAEQHISGIIDYDVIVSPYHHFVVDSDVQFAPNTNFTIMSNAVVRINPGQDLIIHGNLTAHGEENNMFWITSNDGFADNLKSKMNNDGDGKEHSSSFILHSSLTKRDSLALYNSMQLSPVASVSDNLIEWGKWSWGNSCLLNQVDNLHMENGIFRDGECGYQVADVDLSMSTKILSDNLISDEHAGVYYYLTLDGYIENSICLNSMNGIKLKDKCDVEVRNCYLSKNNYGVKLWQCMGNIHNNEFSNNGICDIGFTGNHLIEEGYLNIAQNELYSSFAIKQFAIEGSSFNQYTTMVSTENNFGDNDWYIYLINDGMSGDIFADNCYFNGMISIEEIKSKIRDFEEHYSIPKVIIINVHQFKNQAAGIQ